MALATISNARDVVEVLIGAVSVLGGFMAAWSGFAASRSVRKGEPPDALGNRINEGLAVGFEFGLPVSLLALIILAS